MRPRTKIFRNRLLSSVKIAPIAMLGGLALGAFPLAPGHAEDAKVEDVIVSGSGADNPNKLTRDETRVLLTTPRSAGVVSGQKAQVEHLDRLSDFSQLVPNYRPNLPIRGHGDPRFAASGSAPERETARNPTRASSSTMCSGRMSVSNGAISSISNPSRSASAAGQPSARTPRSAMSCAHAIAVIRAQGDFETLLRQLQSHHREAECHRADHRRHARLSRHILSRQGRRLDRDKSPAPAIATTIAGACAGNYIMSATA